MHVDFKTQKFNYCRRCQAKYNRKAIGLIGLNSGLQSSVFDPRPQPDNNCSGYQQSAKNANGNPNAHAVRVILEKLVNWLRDCRQKAVNYNDNRRDYAYRQPSFIWPRTHATHTSISLQSLSVLLFVAPYDFPAVIIHLKNGGNAHTRIAPANIIYELKHVDPSTADPPSVSAKNHVASNVRALTRETKAEITRVHLKGIGAG